jgi:plastocyanin
MRAFRICGCWLLSVALLGILGCGNTTYTKKGPEVKTNTVKISNCKADPDTAQVPKGDTLTWTIDPSDTHTYSIKFTKSTPVSSSTVPTGQGQKVTGDFFCNTLGGISTSLCVYSYNLVQDSSKTCPDPGVHVVPNSN